MIGRVKFVVGAAPGKTALEIEAAPVNVFVGPNNSGKSKVLNEIARYCSSGVSSTTDVILGDVTFEPTSQQITNEKIERFRVPPHPGETLQPGHVIVGKRGARSQYHRATLEQVIQTPHSNLNAYCQWYLRYHLLNLDGQSRIGLVNQQGAGNLQLPPVSSFQVLFLKDDIRAEARRIVHAAFGKYLVVDPTNLGQLNLRLSDRPPTDAMEERGLHDAAIQFHSAALPIDQASDGVKAFVGIVIEVLAGNPEILLIDEPEAFLHPSLAFSLGKELAQIARGSNKNLFVSTHSATFVMGCIQSGAPVNIIRLTYRDGVATARTLAKERLLALMRNPLLRSTGVLAGLFYECVVVTESDADRAFYQEINERLLRVDPDKGIPNCLFLNAQNKQTVQTIVRPLRELGIPAAGIVDIDVVKEGGSVWSSLLASFSIPELEHSALASLRGAVKTKMDATGGDMKREGGVTLLGGSDAEAAHNLFDRLAEYGLFVVRRGELESWLQGLGATGHGPSWLIQVFEKMGEDPNIAEYVGPSGGDVWNFLYEIEVWLKNPLRKGIPSGQ